MKPLYINIIVGGVSCLLGAGAVLAIEEIRMRKLSKFYAEKRVIDMNQNATLKEALMSVAHHPSMQERVQKIVDESRYQTIEDDEELEEMKNLPKSEDRQMSPYEIVHANNKEMHQLEEDLRDEMDAVMEQAHLSEVAPDLYHPITAKEWNFGNSEYDKRDWVYDIDNNVLTDADDDEVIQFGESLKNINISAFDHTYISNDHRREDVRITPIKE